MAMELEGEDGKKRRGGFLLLGFPVIVLNVGYSLAGWSISISTGEDSTEFLFTRARLGWNVMHFSYFATINSVLRVTGLCGVLLRGQVSDTFLAGLGYVSALGGTITKSLAWKSWHMYLGMCIGVLMELSPSSIRSIISKNVPTSDVGKYGKVFSLATVLEILCTLVGAPIFTMIYSNYLPPIYPSPVYLRSSSVYLLLLICVMSVEMLIRKSREPPNYTAAAQEDF